MSAGGSRDPDEASFSALQEVARGEGTAAVFEKLAELLRGEKKYAQLFDALLMKKRSELGLSLLGGESLRDLPEPVQVELENYYVDACRRVGALFLEAGDIPAAWPYFRAIDEASLVAEALDRWEPPPLAAGSYEDTQRDTVIDIALNQGANPRRGYELVLAHYGVCRAITVLEHQFPYAGEVKEKCAGLLVRRLHRDLLENLRADIGRREGTTPAENDIRKLIENRSWLFDDHGYHIDMSHLQSVIRIASGLKGQEELTLALEMAEYGRKLPRDFQNADRPPFEDFYNDYRIFLQALAGIGVDGAVRYFGAKAERAGPDEDGKHFPAEILVYLLYRVGRYREAIEAHRKFLRNSPRPLAAAPSLFDLCELQGDFTPLLEAARERGDLVEFTAGLVKKHAAAGGAD